MKKLISTILLLSMAVAFSFAAPKKEKEAGTKLDPKINLPLKELQ